MNAIELADGIDEKIGPTETTRILRKQYEAIVKLREALSCSLWRMNEYGYQAMEGTIARAEQALKDTAQFDSKSQPAYTEEIAK